jgi:ankyrin repeat protein
MRSIITQKQILFNFINNGCIKYFTLPNSAVFPYHYCPNQESTMASLTVGASPRPDLRLEESIGKNDIQGVRDALQAGADPNTWVDEGRRNVLHLVCDEKVQQVEAVKELLHHRADPNAEQYHFRDTPLHRASLRGHADIVKELISSRAHVNKINAEGNTPLERAISWGHLDCCKLLVAAGVPVNYRTVSYRKSTPLILACEALDTSSVTKVSPETQRAMVNFLLDTKADPNLDDTRKTPLMAAATNPELLRILIDRGAKVNDEIPLGSEASVPLHTAAYHGCPEAVKLLLAARANPHARNAARGIPLTSAIKHLKAQEASPSNGPEVTQKFMANLKAAIELLKPFGSDKCMVEQID